jgi:hypothetical protein
MPVALLHLPDSLRAQSSNFMLFHSHLLTLHLLKHLLVASLLSFALIPFIVPNLSDNSIVFFFLLLLLLEQSLLMLPNFLLNHFLAQLNQTDLEPLFEHLVRLFLLHLFSQSFFLLQT